MQKYKGNLDSARIRTINGYQYAILVLNQSEIERKLGITPNICKHIPMIREIMKLESKGEKLTYIYEVLGAKYSVSPSTVKRIRKSFLNETFV